VPKGATPCPSGANRKENMLKRYVRKQILFSPWQVEYLEAMQKKTGRAFSEYIREVFNLYLISHPYGFSNKNKTRQNKSQIEFEARKLAEKKLSNL
jgi:hypothetical protein